MNRFCILLFLLLGLVQQARPQSEKGVYTQKDPGTERRLALVIGIGNYDRYGPLSGPANDADDMARVLRSLGFEVILLKNSSKLALRKAIDDFAEKLRQYDVGLFYFSGHGVGVNGQNYLVPTDAQMVYDTQVEDNCVPLNRVINGMEGANVKVNLILLDACRNNPLLAGIVKDKAPTMLESNGFFVPNNPQGSFIAFSTRDGKPSLTAATMRNSLFTSELLQELQKPDVGIRTMIDRTTSRVIARSKEWNMPKEKIQMPCRFDALEGDFVFIRRIPEPAKPSGMQKYLDLPFADMVYVEGGTFAMGDTRGEGEYNEKPVHQVTVSSFLMGKYEVTQRQWEAVMGSNPSYFKDCPDCPVEQVSWEDVQVFLQKLNARTGGHYRLPTEAEWEYAAGGGGAAKRSRFGNGQDVLDPKQANFDGSAANKELYSVAGVYRAKLVRVGSFSPNGLGLYDLTGNVWEWCSDWYGSYGSSTQTELTGPPSGTYRVLRGGSWDNGPQNCRVTNRDYYIPTFRFFNIGFRVVSSLQ